MKFWGEGAGDQCRTRRQEPEVQEKQMKEKAAVNMMELAMILEVSVLNVIRVMN